jgi:hypothetical protein
MRFPFFQVPQSRRKEVLHQKLAELNLPETFCVPVDPTFVAKGLSILLFLVNSLSI